MQREILVEEASNFEEKCPVTLVLDTSASMEGEGIESLNKALSQFMKDVSKNVITRNRLELSIIAYNNIIDVKREFSTPRNNSEIQTLYAEGQTYTESAIDKAIDMVTERKAYLVNTGVSYKRPYIILITDGQMYGEGQDVDRLKETIRKGETNKNFIFWAFGVANADMEELDYIKGPNSIVKEIHGVENFSTFFKFLSNSIEIIAKAKNGSNADLSSVLEKDNFMVPIRSGN